MMSVSLVLFLQLLTVVVIWILVRIQIRRGTSHGAVTNRLDNEVQGLITELNRTTDQNVTVLEDRLQVLRRELNTVEQKILELKELNDRTETKDSEEGFVLDLDRNCVEEIEVRNTQRDVIQLSESGISPELIAAQLELAIGEVELILSLHNRRSRGR